MKESLSEALDSLEPLTKKAAEALRRYHEAKSNGSSVENIERLRLEAESLFQAISDYQSGVLGAAQATRH